MTPKRQQNRNLGYCGASHGVIPMLHHIARHDGRERYIRMARGRDHVHARYARAIAITHAYVCMKRAVLSYRQTTKH